MSDTIKLLAPQNCAPVVRDGVTYTPDDNNLVEVPGDLLEDFQQHGFTLYAPDSADDPNSAPVEDIDTMSRGELFAFLKAKGVAVRLPINNDQLRTLAKDGPAAPATAAPAPAAAPVAPVAPATPLAAAQ